MPFPCVCGDCGLVVDSPAELTDHLQEHLPEKEDKDVNVKREIDFDDSAIGRGQNDSLFGLVPSAKLQPDAATTSNHHHFARLAIHRMRVCVTCGEMFPTHDLLKKHRDAAHSKLESSKLKHTDSVKIYSCRSCRKKFYLVTELKQHIERGLCDTETACDNNSATFLSESVDGDGGREQAVHRDCGDINDTRAAFNRLLGTSAPDSSLPFACATCQHKFSTLECLKRHVSVVHDSFTRRFCWRCGKVCVSLVQLRWHIRVHERVDRDLIKSSECQRNKPGNKQTIRHRLKVVKPIKRQSIEPAAVFTVPRSRPSYPCPDCTLKFACEPNLKIHQQEHCTKQRQRKPAKPTVLSGFKCNRCESVFETKQRRLGHILREHSPVAGQNETTEQSIETNPSDVEMAGGNDYETGLIPAIGFVKVEVKEEYDV